MKKYIRCLAAVLLPNLLLITATQAQNLEQVRRLLATNECLDFGQKKSNSRNYYANTIRDNISSISARRKAEKYLFQSVIE